jgi:hypothetical protein
MDKKSEKTVAVKGYLEGGAVQGPPGPDAVPAKLTQGEYVLPPEIVDYHGVQALDQFVEQTRMAIMKRAQPPQPNEWMDLFADEDNPPVDDEPVEPMEKPSGPASPTTPGY